MPQFAYQIHLASGEVEKSVKDEQSIRQFLRGMYGARGPNGELAFDPEKGVLAENLPKIGESRILNGKVSSKIFEGTRHEHIFMEAKLDSQPSMLVADVLISATRGFQIENYSADTVKGP